MTRFEQSFFKNNRQKLTSLFKGTAPIVIAANGLLQKNSDITFPFRQDSSFWYLTGINVPGAILVMEKGREYVILPTQNEHSEIFDGTVNNEELIKTSGVSDVLSEDEGWRQLGSRLKRSKHVATLPALSEFIDAYGFYSNPSRAKVILKMKEYNADLELLDLRAHITKMRAVKQSGEIAAIKEAIRITGDALKTIKKGIKKFAYEYEVEAVVSSTFLKQNSNPAYGSIVAGGKNASIIHYQENNSKLNPQDLLLLDIGAEVDYYSADITRVFSMNAKPSKRQRQVYAAVRDVQEYAFSLLKPGIILKDYEDHIEHYMGEQLRVLGLISTINHKNVRRYYPHSTSHFLGLDTHDVGDYEQPLEAGMVVTVEPGIYIPEESIGVRIEDDILITKDGFELLSDNLPSLIN